MTTDNSREAPPSQGDREAAAERDELKVYADEQAELVTAYIDELTILQASHDRLAGIVELARELVSPAGMVNRGVDRGLVVIEKADKSDPHYRLCTALAALSPSDQPQEGGKA
jgi:hypothetical protein